MPDIEGCMRSAVESIAASLKTDPKVISLTYRGEWMEDRHDDGPCPIKISCDLLVPAKDKRSKPYYYVCSGSGETVDEALEDLIRNVSWHVGQDGMELVRPGIELLEPYPRRW